MADDGREQWKTSSGGHSFQACVVASIKSISTRMRG
jgi:hypothetical protein